MPTNNRIEEIKKKFDLTTEDGRTRCYLSAMLESIQHKDSGIDEDALAALRIELKVTEKDMLHCLETL